MRKLFLQTSGALLIYTLSFSFVYATKTTQFIDLLANKIFNECGGQEIFLKADSVAGGVVIGTNPDLKDTDVKNLQTFSRTLSPLSRNEIKSLVRNLTQSEPYITYSNYPKAPTSADIHITKIATLYGKSYEFSSSGLGILSCGDKALDINGDQYFWNGELIEVPKIENTYSLTFLGLSIISNGGFTVFAISIFSLGLLSVSIVSISFILYFFTSVRKRVKIWIVNKVSE